MDEVDIGFPCEVWVLERVCEHIHTFEDFHRRYSDYRLRHLELVEIKSLIILHVAGNHHVEEVVLQW